MANVHDLIDAAILKVFNPEKFATFLDSLEDSLKAHINSTLDNFKVELEAYVDAKIAALNPSHAGEGTANITSTQEHN